MSIQDWDSGYADASAHGDTKLNRILKLLEEITQDAEDYAIKTDGDWAAGYASGLSQALAHVRAVDGGF